MNIESAGGTVNVLLSRRDNDQVKQARGFSLDRVKTIWVDGALSEMERILHRANAASWLPSAPWQWSHMIASRRLLALIGSLVGGLIIGLATGLGDGVSFGLRRGFVERMIGGLIAGPVLGAFDGAIVNRLLQAYFATREF